MNVLLASHGTIGAKEAENAAIKMCTAKTQLTHLCVIPELWKHMLGDDWLNNSKTRITFENYLESQLLLEVENNLSRVKEIFTNKGIRYTAKIAFGKPDKCLLDYCSDKNFDCVVMGSPRPKDIPGIKSKMLTATLRKKLATPLVTTPHPNA